MDTGGMFRNASLLRILRLLRLTRMARMLKLLVHMPEIMIVIRAICTATRTVFVTMFLLTIICYTFAIFFTQMSRGTTLSDQYFGSVGQSLSTLLLTGAFPDQYDIMTEAGAESYIFWFPLLIFIT